MVKSLPAMWETRFDPWIGKILWRRQWHPTPVLLPGKSHGWSVVGCSPWGQRVRQGWATSLSLFNSAGSPLPRNPHRPILLSQPQVPWTERRSNQSIPKEISPEYSLEGLMLKLKLQLLANWCEELTHWKRPWCWERLKAGGEGDDRGWDDWMASPTQ